MGAPRAMGLLALYPKKAVSAAAGALSRLKLPRPFRMPIYGRFARAYGANLDEAERPLEEYASLLDFFTRRLKPGLRPQDPGVPGGINSPVDGTLIASGSDPIPASHQREAGTLLQG